MAIITFEDWVRENPKLKSKPLDYDELPPIVLNPIVFELWKHKYYKELKLDMYLHYIQENDFAIHPRIKSDLEQLGVIIESVGSDDEDENLFDWIKTKELYGHQYSINDYLKEHQDSMCDFPSIKMNRVGNCSLYWDDWWFASGLFVFDMGNDEYPFINWMAVNPFSLKG